MDTEYFKSFRQEFESAKPDDKDEESSNHTIKNLFSSFEEINIQKIEQNNESFLKQFDEFQDNVSIKETVKG